MGGLDFKTVNPACLKKHKAEFVLAACNHLAEAVRLFENLPRPK